MRKMKNLTLEAKNMNFSQEHSFLQDLSFLQESSYLDESLRYLSQEESWALFPSFEETSSLSFAPSSSWNQNTVLPSSISSLDEIFLPLEEEDGSELSPLQEPDFVQNPPIPTQGGGVLQNSLTPGSVQNCIIPASSSSLQNSLIPPQGGIVQNSPILKPRSVLQNSLNPTVGGIVQNSLIPASGGGGVVQNPLVPASGGGGVIQNPLIPASGGGGVVQNSPIVASYGVAQNHSNPTPGVVVQNSPIPIVGGVVQNPLNPTSSRGDVVQNHPNPASGGVGVVQNHPNPAPVVELPNFQPNLLPYKSNRWTETEHRLFLYGLSMYGKGNWKTISQELVKTRSPSQVASHAQKFFIRLASENKSKRRSIHDIRP